MENYSSKLYLDIRDRHSKSFGELPIIFAFSNEQLKEGMRDKFNLDIDKDEDLKKLMSIGHGGFMLKSDKPLLDSFLSKESTEQELYRLGTDDDIIGAYIYELENHEFMINSDIDFDLSHCFDSIKEDLMNKAKAICWDRYYHTDYYD